MLKNYSEKYLQSAVDLFIDIFTSQPFAYSWLERDRIIRYLNDLNGTPNFKGFVWLAKGEPAGFCYGVVNDYFQFPSFEVKEIFIKKEIQGKGNGAKFLHYIEKKLCDEGIFNIVLLTSKNIPAHDFYIKQGYISSDSTVYFSKLVR